MHTKKTKGCKISNVARCTDRKYVHCSTIVNQWDEMMKESKIIIIIIFLYTIDWCWSLSAEGVVQCATVSSINTHEISSQLKHPTSSQDQRMPHRETIQLNRDVHRKIIECRKMWEYKFGNERVRIWKGIQGIISTVVFSSRLHLTAPRVSTAFASCPRILFLSPSAVDHFDTLFLDPLVKLSTPEPMSRCKTRT